MSHSAEQLQSASDASNGMLGRESTAAYILGAFLLVVPDLCIFFLIMPWWKPHLSWTTALSFFLIDSAVGLLSVFLIRICRQKGVLADLILVALRIGQMAVVYAVGLTLFAHDTLNLLLFSFLPVLLFVCQGMGMRAHMSDILDHVRRRPADAPEDS